ncbi:hypothetical protein IEQ34_023611 [Dendrobium chrysotoxum]|uniref:Uncharacterized protein n=1 Tax=Dendrobium chrysotoxum TaxID=161865 RepID=A0AAV7FU43_DENCH|nr:hypothetical protein IEQ34_024458 [Dendrobium chrysotoxum]KAH0447556.1 hypothetical protein IEQ34_023611 [Dendrobium chrysotoxum]
MFGDFTICAAIGDKQVDDPRRPCSNFSCVRGPGLQRSSRYADRRRRVRDMSMSTNTFPLALLELSPLSEIERGASKIRSFLFEKEKGQYWSEIRGALDQASSQTE